MKYSNWRSNEKGYVIDDDTGATMCEVFGDNIKDRNAKSKLIAAAPELLEHLQLLIKRCEENGFHHIALILCKDAIKKTTV